MERSPIELDRVRLQSPDEFEIWVNIYAKALMSPSVRGNDGKATRGFADKTAALAILRMREAEENE